MKSGTVTLNPTALEQACDAVYLLTDADIPPDGGVTYEATLDGATWVAVTPGQLTALGHVGTQLQLRATLTLDEASDDETNVYWLVGYATTEEA